MRLTRAALPSLLAVVLPLSASAHESSFTLFGSTGSLNLGLSVHTHRHHRVVQAAPVVVAPPPVVYVAPPPVVVEAVPVPPPVMVAQPVIVAAPVPAVVPVQRVVVTQPAPPQPDRPALIGLKYTPGVSTLMAIDPNRVSFTGLAFAHSFGLEARLSRWFALRSDAELRSTSRSYDVIGLKVWLAGADWKVKPYLSASLSGTTTDSRPNALSIGAVGAAGLDIFFGKHFFLETEVRARALPSSCCSEVPLVTATAGAGVAFF